MDIFSQDCNSRPDFSHDLKLYCSSSFDRLHIHKSSELILVREGRLEITVASRAFSLESGDAILVLPFEPHAFDGSRAKFVVHLFAERYAEEFFRILGGKSASAPVFRPTRESVEYYLHCFGIGGVSDSESECCDLRVTCPDFTASSGISAMLARFLESVRLEHDPSGELRSRLLALIESQFREKLTLDLLADQLGYEPHYLSRLIPRLTGMGLNRLIDGFRIEAAIELLRGGELNMTAIAHSCGFGSLRNFDRSFARVIGCSPSEWRKFNRIFTDDERGGIDKRTQDVI